MATSRETVRDALVALLAAALVGDGLPVKTCSGSKQTALAGVTPLVVVLSRGTERAAVSFGDYQASFFFYVQVWVLQSGTGWTHAQAEDALDSIEALIAGVVEDNDGTAGWTSLEYLGPSEVVEAAVEGTPYYMETISLRVEV